MMLHKKVIEIFSVGIRAENILIKYELCMEGNT